MQFSLQARSERLTPANQHRGSAAVVVLMAIVVAGLAAACWLLFTSSDSNPASNSVEVESDKQNHSSTKLYQVTIRKPDGPPVVDTGLTDANGAPVTVSCSTCHTNREPNSENKSVADLNEFHGSLEFAHGTVSCLSCHNSEDYDALKLADGTRVEFTDVMTLCAQCHGPQMRDYEHGVHGGMNGHWDLTRGPRTKNNCVDCHNPHSPKFPHMRPTFKPKDRFLEKANGH